MRTCEHVDMWRCGHVDMRTCGHADNVDISTCRYADMATFGHVDMRTCGHVDPGSSQDEPGSPQVDPRSPQVGPNRVFFFNGVDYDIDLETIINGRSMPWSFGCTKRRLETTKLKPCCGEIVKTSQN